MSELYSQDQECCVCQEQCPDVDLFGMPLWGLYVSYLEDDGETSSTVAICIPCLQESLQVLGTIVRERKSPLKRRR